MVQKAIWSIAALSGALLIGGPALATDPPCIGAPAACPIQTNDPGVSLEVHVEVPMDEAHAAGAVIVDVDVVVGEPAATNISVDIFTPGGPDQHIEAGNQNRP